MPRALRAIVLMSQAERCNEHTGRASPALDKTVPAFTCIRKRTHSLDLADTDSPAHLLLFLIGAGASPECSQELPLREAGMMNLRARQCGCQLISRESSHGTMHRGQDGWGTLEPFRDLCPHLRTLLEALHEREAGTR